MHYIFFYTHCLSSIIFKQQHGLAHPWMCDLLISLISLSLNLWDHVSFEEKNEKKLRNDAGWACQYKSILDNYKTKQPYCHKGFERIKWTILTRYHGSIWWVVSDECSHFLVKTLICDEFHGLSLFLTVLWTQKMLPWAKLLLYIV